MLTLSKESICIQMTTNYFFRAIPTDLATAKYTELKVCNCYLTQLFFINGISFGILLQ